ncbi:MAG: tripartite tricarboxylate transporter substrate binding protein [Betaproteobacteria bacterium]|nr:tripartite tricarboxylate transporter substrate binding protein [Betaproteobacteria bacterium]
MKKGLFAALIAGAVLGTTAATVLAQVFPNKPIRIVVPFTPGGGNDVYGRVIGQKLQERLGQPAVVENKPGAGGNIGAEFVAKSAADGYTLLVVQSGITMVPWVSKSVPFDVLKDFAPLGIGTTQPMVVVVANNIPVKSIKELIAHAKANPGRLSYATPGVGTPHHLVTELFMGMTGTKMVHVPYKGASGMLANLMSGEVHVMIGALNSAIPLFQSGKIRALAVAERQRLRQFEELPTVNESLPGYEANIWYGLMAPAGTPEAITNKLSEEQRAIVNLPTVREQLARVGMDSNPTSAAEMRQIMTTELAKWGKVVKDAGIQPQ